MLIGRGRVDVESTSSYPGSQEGYWTLSLISSKVSRLETRLRRHDISFSRR